MASHTHHAQASIEAFKRQIDQAHTKLPFQSILDLQTNATNLKGGIMTSQAIESVNKLYMVMNDK